MTRAEEIVEIRRSDLADFLAGSERRFLSIESASHYTDLSTKSLRRLIADGSLTAYRPVRGKVLVDRRQLDHLVLSSTGRIRVGRGHGRESQDTND